MKKDVKQNELDGANNDDLQLFVRFADREPGCTVLDMARVNGWQAWKQENVDAIANAIRDISQLKLNGKGHYSVYAVIERIRHFRPHTVTDPNYKINCHIAPLLARYIIFKQPSLRNFFELRSPKKRQPLCPMHRCNLVCPECTQTCAQRIVPATEMVRRTA